MHPAVLDATGYILLLSSLITLVILLRKGCKYKEKSPFYILSTSDVFSTIFTAIILLVNHVQAGIKLSYNRQNNTSSTPNRTWTIEDEGDYQLPFLQIRKVTDETGLNVNLTCDMKDILMQYGMLLATLTNAFISLLIFTVQSNFNAAYIKQRCANIIKSSMNNVQPERKDVEATQSKREILEDEEEPTLQQRDNINVKNRSSVIRRIMKISTFQMPKDDRKPAGFLVTGQWLVPLLVVGTLYFAEYNDMNSIRHTKDSECVFESNFPMSNFYMFSDVEENLKIVNSIIHMTPLKNNYFVNEEYSNKLGSSNVKVDEIVSKVQNIVRTALNYTGNTESTGIINYPDSSESQSAMDYILANNKMSYTKNNTNINYLIQRLNNTLMKQNVSVRNSSSNTNNNDIYVNQDPEMSLLHHLLKNVSDELNTTISGNLSDGSQISAENKNDSYQGDAQIYFAITEESTTQRSTDIPIVQNRTPIFSQIYSDIMKRIQAAGAHTAVKSHYNRSVHQHHNEEQPKRNNSTGRIMKRKPNAIKNLFSSKNVNLSHYINMEMQSGSLHVTNECLVSTDFLKLHLFVLSFAIYFLPILFSCILQMRGKHMCKNALAILKTKTDLTSALSHSDVNPTVDGAAIKNETRSERRLSLDGKRTCRQYSIDESDTSQELSNDHSSKTDTEAIKKHHECYRELQNEDILLETDCMIRIFNIIKLSLILCVILWTPMFLGTLLRVYSCASAPQWLTDTTFLSAISFGIVRNILNINIIKIHEICGDARTKENRIHPIK